MRAKPTAGSAASQRDARDRTRANRRTTNACGRFVDSPDPGAPAGLRSRPAAEPDDLCDSVPLWL